MEWLRNSNGVKTISNVSGRILLDTLDIGSIPFGIWIIVCDSILNPNNKEFSILNATIASNNEITYNRFSHLIIGNHIGLSFDVTKDTTKLAVYGITSTNVNYNIFRFWSNQSYSDPILLEGVYGSNTKVPQVVVDSFGRLVDISEVSITQANNDPLTISVPGQRPLTTELQLGKFAINTYDGTVYIKKNDGTDKIVPLVSNVSQPGGGIVKQITSGSIPAFAGTTIIPYDNTTPLITEGTAIWSKSYTPTSLTSNILINCSFSAEVTTGNRYVIAAVFRNSTCIGTSLYRFGNSGYITPFQFLIIDLPNTTSTVTYSCRVGISNSATWYVNREAASILNGTLASNGFIILEW